MKSNDTMTIDNILQKWDEAKVKKAMYEKECDLCRDSVERYMKKKEQDSLQGSRYNVSKRTITREQLPKKDLPSDIWDKYSSKFTYTSYYLKKRTS